MLKDVKTKWANPESTRYGLSGEAHVSQWSIEDGRVTKGNK